MERWAEVDGDNPWFAADAARLTAVRADRAAAAERYFSGHAGQWDALRSLHVAETEVEAAIGRALSESEIGRLVDIGTGTGRMIELFGPSAAHATGIDRSPEMLRLARVKLAEAGTMLTGMTGAYILADGDDGIEVTYELAVDVRIPMIGMVRRKAEKRIIDTALRGLKRRVEG